MLGLALAGMLATLAQAGGPSSLAQELGLFKTENGLEYRRQSCRQEPPKIRTLTEAEAADPALTAFLSRVEKLSGEALEKALTEPLLKAAAEAEIPPDQLLWLEPAPAGFKATACGRSAVVGCLLKDPWAGRFPSDTPPVDLGLPRISLNRDLSRYADPNYDGGASRAAVPEASPRVELDFVWGSGTRAEVHARNTRSVYSLYAYGKDSFNNLLADPEENPGTSRAMRLLETPADLGLAYLRTLFNHEVGHIENARRAGADASWVPSDGPYALGHVIEIPAADWSRMSPAQIQAFNAGGVNATQASLSMLRAAMFEKDRVDWSFFPMWIQDKADFIAYALSAPKPSRQAPEDYANDMLNYSERYGARSGQNPDDIHQQLVRGAVWTALDPTNLLALYGYGVNYVWNGETTTKNPMLRVGEREYWAGTGFQLSEVGPMYSLDILSRDPRTGSLLRVTPKMGDDNQWGVGGQLTNFRLAEGSVFRGRVGLEAWQQREAAEPGPRRWGGAATLGVSADLFQSGGVYLDAGYKTPGAMLGRDHDAGPFVVGGLSVRF